MAESRPAFFHDGYHWERAAQKSAAACGELSFHGLLGVLSGK